MKSIDRTDFENVELRAGSLAMVEESIESRKPAFNLFIDFREEIG